MLKKVGEVWENVPEPESKGPVLVGAVVLVLVVFALAGGCNSEAAQGQPTDGKATSIGIVP